MGWKLPVVLLEDRELTPNHITDLDRLSYTLHNSFWLLTITPTPTLARSKSPFVCLPFQSTIIYMYCNLSIFFSTKFQQECDGENP